MLNDILAFVYVIELLKSLSACCVKLIKWVYSDYNHGWWFLTWPLVLGLGLVLALVTIVNSSYVTCTSTIKRYGNNCYWRVHEDSVYIFGLFISRNLWIAKCLLIVQVLFCCVFSKQVPVYFIRADCQLPYSDEVCGSRCCVYQWRDCWVIADVILVNFYFTILGW